MEPTIPSPAQGAPAPHQAPTSVLAIASLVCGVVGLVLLPLSLVAILLGIIALIKVNGSGGRLRGLGLAIGGVATGAVGLLLMLAVAAMVIPMMLHARERARQASSASNLSKIIMACHLYSDDPAHNGRFPDDPTDLYPAYVKDWRTFKNPRFPDADAGYMYIPGSSPVDPENVVFYENVPAGRAQEGRNVVISAGSVSWMTDSEFQSALNATRQALDGKLTPVPVSVSKVMKKGP